MHTPTHSNSPFLSYRKKSSHKGPDIIYRLGGGAEDFRGDHLIFERKKGGSVVTKNPKGRSLKILEEFRGGHLSNLLGK